MPSHEVVYKDKNYPSFKDLCAAHGKNTKTVRVRMKTYGWTLERALETPLRSSTPVVYDGIEYSSLHALCRKLDKKL